MSHKAISWSGVFPAVTTQFRNDFSLDLDATHTVIKNLVRDGVSAWWCAAPSVKTPR